MEAQTKPYELYIRNARLLPAFYLLPAEMVIGGCEYKESRDKHKRPYRDFPRNAYEAVLDEKWRAEIKKEKFAVYVLDGLSYLLWPAFEEKDKLNTFSSDDPLWRLVLVAAGESIELLKEYGYTKEGLMRVPRGYYIDYLPYADAEAIMIEIGRRLIARNDWQELIDYIKKNRCFEDFNGTCSKDYLSFFRSWHRTRFCEWVTYSESGVYNLQKDSFHTNPYYESICKMDYKTFLSMQDDETLELIRLLENRDIIGGLQGVAERLGLKTHSAVSKRSAKLNAELSEWFLLPPPEERDAQRKRDEAQKKERFVRRKLELNNQREKETLEKMLGFDYSDQQEKLIDEAVQGIEAIPRPHILPKDNI